jgi:hypothetical protein
MPASTEQLRQAVLAGETEATWNAVTTDRSHLLSSTVNARAAGMIAGEWAGQLDAKTTTGRQPVAETLAAHEHHDQRIREAVKALNRGDEGERDPVSRGRTIRPASARAEVD